MPTTMNVQVAHQVPGRVRLKVPGVKESPELVDQIKQMFNAIPGIEEVTVNPTTGSVVLRYDTDHHDAFHGHLEKHHTGGHERPRPTRSTRSPARSSRKPNISPSIPTPPASSSITSGISMKALNLRPETSSI